MIRIGFVSAVSVVLVVLASGSPLAQEPPAESGAPADSTEIQNEPTDLDRVRVLLRRLDELRDALQEMRGDAVEEGEALQLRRLVALDRVKELDDLTSDVVKLVPMLDDGAASTDSVRSRVKGHLEYQADLYEKAIEGLRGRTASMLGERSTVPPAELGELEIRIAEERAVTDGLMERAADTASRMESIGLDATDVWASFDRLLATRAQLLAGRLQVATHERARLGRQISDARRTGATQDEISSLRLRLLALEPRIDGIARSLDAMATLLDRRGLRSSEYRQILIRTTGEITEHVLDPRVFLGLTRDLLGSFWNWLRSRGPTYVVRILILLLFVLATHVLMRLAWWLILLTSLARPSNLLRDLVGRLLRPFATVTGLVAGLWFLGVDATALLTGVGVIGVIVGLALQDSLANLAAGAFILAYRPYDVDDVVQAGGVVGTVKMMGLANTTIHTFDNRRLAVPNRKIWAEVIENRSSQHLRRVETVFPISYEDDLGEAIRIISELLDELELVLKKPEPEIFVLKLADAWIDLAVRPWTRTETWWTLTKELPKLLRDRLAEAGIQVPYPRQEIEVSYAEDADSQGPTKRPSQRPNP